MDAQLKKLQNIENCVNNIVLLLYPHSSLWPEYLFRLKKDKAHQIENLIGKPIDKIAMLDGNENNPHCPCCHYYINFGKERYCVNPYSIQFEESKQLLRAAG